MSPDHTDGGTPPAAAEQQADDIKALRAHLFAAIAAVKTGAMDIDQARTVNELCKTIVDTGRLEVEHIRVTGQDDHSRFIAPPPDAAGNATHALPNGITGIVRHRLRG